MGYNLRVYGILINEKKQVLLSHERKGKLMFTKFPGGGHELGEGLQDCLLREFQEELQLDVKITSHFYTTDFYQASVFNDNDQLISFYYKVETPNAESIVNGAKNQDDQSDNFDYFFWKDMNELTSDDVTFPIDKKVVDLLIREFNK